MRIHRLDENYDTQNAMKAINDIELHKAKGEILTGLMYLEPTASNFHEINDTTATPLNQLPQDLLCPGERILNTINDSFR